MQDDATTDNQGEHPLDVEDWELAFEPYSKFPGQALSLGFNFVALKSYLTINPPKIKEAVESFDCAMEVLYKYTQFHGVAYDLFRRLVEGKLTIEEEALLKSLGLKF